MKPLYEQLNRYQSHHQNRINCYLHYVGVPAIIFSLILFFNWISIDIASLWRIPFSWILVAGTLLYYLILNIRLGLIATIFFVVFTYVADAIAKNTPTETTAILFLVLFFGGWILQFVGHFFEKQRPAFFTGFMQLFIGPLFVIVELLKQLKIDKYIL